MAKELLVSLLNFQFRMMVKY